MRILDIPMAQKPHGDVFEELIERGEIQFHSAKIEDQYQWAKMLISLYLDGGMGLGYPWRVGDVGVRDPRSEYPSICVKVDGSNIIKYLDIYPCSGQFLLVGDEEHHESVHPDQFHLQQMIAGGKAKSGRVIVRDDGSSIMELETPEGDQVVIADNKARIVENGRGEL